ncbi:MAG: hypothetical protein IKT46_07255 [Clostridia bacterium]|nr:hypothetical protein [Clostridia bacterium]
MKTLFISSQAPNTIKSMLCSIGFSLVLLPADPNLPEPVSAHADMLIFENIIQKDYYKRNKELFLGYDLILAEESFGNEYPGDVLLNAFTIGDTLFGHLESLSKEIRNLYLKQVNLRQGYAKCSTLLFGNNAITADRGIASALSEHGVNVLLITPGHIALPGYDYGFIGGASFVYEDKVIFFGNIEEHPDGVAILDFIGQAGYEAVYDKTEKPVDLGGAATLSAECGMRIHDTPYL